MMKKKFLAIVPCLFLFHSEDGLAASNVLVWQGAVSLKSYKCKPPIDTIQITGTAILSHPDDVDLKQPAQQILVFCDNLKFDDNAEIQSLSHLDFRIANRVVGIVKLTGTRGQPGAPADPTPDLWKPTKAKSAPEFSGPAGNGHNAIGTSLEYPAGRTCDDGSPGATGGNGDHGAPVAPGLLGAPGHNGNNANNITLVAGSFENTELLWITATGGRGGQGGRGARGQDGGDGARGQDGGGGGSASEVTKSCRGGDGGNGGNGGNGARGGQGGPGGDGGRGGNVTVGLKKGAKRRQLQQSTSAAEQEGYLASVGKAERAVNEERVLVVAGAVTGSFGTRAHLTVEAGTLGSPGSPATSVLLGCPARMGLTGRLVAPNGERSPLKSSQGLQTNFAARMK